MASEFDINKPKKDEDGNEEKSPFGEDDYGSEDYERSPIKKTLPLNPHENSEFKSSGIKKGFSFLQGTHPIM